MSATPSSSSAAARSPLATEPPTVVAASVGVGRRLGILGGGQLGRMLALAARPLGIRTVVCDPTPNCPAACAADEHIVGSFTDAAVIESLSNCDAVTIEIEHINTDALARLSERVVVEPDAHTISVIQDKLEQKLAMRRLGVPLGDFAEVADAAAVAVLASAWGYPLMLKSRRLAYDGRGNAVVASEEGILEAWNFLSPKGALYAERWVPFRRELAVLVARGTDGALAAYPTVQTIQKENVCHLVIAPAPASGDILHRAQTVAMRAISGLKGAGVFGVELFELHDGEPWGYLSRSLRDFIRVCAFYRRVACRLCTLLLLLSD